MTKPITVYLFVIVILSFSTILNFSLMQYIYGEEDYDIPSWLVHLAQWDSQGKITNSEYTQAVEYSLKQGFLQRQIAEELIEIVNPSSTPDEDDKCWDKNFPKVNWSGCDFSEKNLNHADLAHANLDGTNFANANLAKASRIEANLEHSYLSHADIAYTDPENAHL